MLVEPLGQVDGAVALGGARIPVVSTVVAIVLPIPTMASRGAAMVTVWSLAVGYRGIGVAGAGVAITITVASAAAMTVPVGGVGGGVLAGDERDGLGAAVGRAGSLVPAAGYTW